MLSRLQWPSPGTKPLEEEEEHSVAVELSVAVQVQLSVAVQVQLLVAVLVQLLVAVQEQLLVAVHVQSLVDVQAQPSVAVIAPWPLAADPLKFAQAPELAYSSWQMAQVEFEFEVYHLQSSASPS